ncbi:hypothetical protein KGP24_23925 (plasmid) [Enterobacter sp. JBIWA008]|nr:MULTISPECIES: hypothetical protein [unclassified Enterobacter]MBA7754802.1 hypothetical protein [Enterobacter sp. RHBSTW-01064]UAN43427.1 hypothetical protein KGP24_23925 [Enterobacter sp. JBIWA008]HEW9972556.1 hypothetical protein [Enterobacter cloacae]
MQYQRMWIMVLRGVPGGNVWNKQQGKKAKIRYETEGIARRHVAQL